MNVSTRVITSYSIHYTKLYEQPLTVNVQGKRLKLKPGTTHKFQLTAAKATGTARTVVRANAKAGR